MFTCVGECCCICEKSCIKPFWLQKESLESASVGDEDYKKKSGGVELKSELTKPRQPAPHLCLKLAAPGYIAATSITHPIISIALYVPDFDNEKESMEKDDISGSAAFFTVYCECNK